MPKKKDGGANFLEEEASMGLNLPSQADTHTTIKPHFFAIIVNPSLQLQKLRLPLKFVKEYGSSLSNYAFLRVSGGSEQRVYLTKEEGNIWFTNGWQSFIEPYSLSFGHFLVFGYEGKSRFLVSIFDTSCFEIEYPTIDMRSSNEDENKDRNHRC